MSPISTDMPPDGFQSITNAIVGRPLGLPGKKRVLYQANHTQLFGEACDSLLDALNRFGRRAAFSRGIMTELMAVYTCNSLQK